MLKQIPTRFRAYQLGTEGSSFSYFSGNRFTLIEARITDESRVSLQQELKICEKSRINTLHITSWDQDHCALKDLELVLSELNPIIVEYPGYPPHTDNAKHCSEAIRIYRSRKKEQGVQVRCQSIDPGYIKGLDPATELAYRDVFYHPLYLTKDNSNDNSTIKLFRDGAFNVASLGDVESSNISSYLRRSNIFKREVDVLILAHHGADNGFTTKRFLSVVKPLLAICSSDYDDKFDHPKPEIRTLLNKAKIPLFTTKTGDVIVESIPSSHSRFVVSNLISRSTEISRQEEFSAKKADLLRHNEDSIRNIYQPGRCGPKKW